MAQENFYKLREKKQTKIIDAIHNCLHNKSYDKLSIMDIVEEADISRASFYEYFVDKKDAIKTMITILSENYQNRFKEIIKMNGGNLFDGIRSYYAELKELYTNNYNMNFIYNLKSLGELLIEMSNNDMYIDETKRFLSWVKDNTIEGKTFINSEKKMVMLFQLVVMVFVFSSIENTIDNKIKMFEKENIFYYQLNIVENGLKSLNDIKI